MSSLTGSEMETHLKVTAWLQIASGALLIFLALFLSTILAVIGVASGEAGAAGIMALVGGGLTVVFGILAIPSLLGGWGLLTRKSWARPLVLVLSFLNLLNVPVGTLIGGYSIWVLLNDDVKRMLEQPRYNELPRY